MTHDPLAARNVILTTIALCALAIARPLLDLLGRNVEIFVAHNSTAVDVVLLALGVTLIAPAVAAIVVLLVARAHRPTGAALHAVVVAGLVAVFVLVTFRVADSRGQVNGWLVVLLATAVGAGFAALYWRNATVRKVLLFAAIAAPVTAGMFLFMTPASRILFPAQAATGAVAVPADAPPIVMLVFDEFPVASLLDAEGGVDAEAFPSFGRLAEDATFFNNTTSVHARTMDAVPAIVSGARSLPDSLPTAADHPTSLFALLGDDYRMHVTEPVTALCPPDACATSAKKEPALRRWRSLARDLAIVEAHLVIPLDQAGSLPPLNEGWRDFSKAGAKDGPRSRKAFLEQGRDKRDRWPTIYRRFVRGIEAGPEPALHFLHVGGLPHYPWIHLQDGRQYQAAPIEGSGLAGVVGIDKGQRWVDRPWPVAQAYQRHLLQVQYVDTLVGDLLDRLEQEGLYDESLIVITADHGASFKPGGPLRKLTRDNIGEVGAVPLFIKEPGADGGSTSTVPAESIDIVPSVLDLLGIPAPEGVEGVSVFGDAITQRTKRRMTEPEHGTDISFGVESQTGDAVASKFELFGANGPFDPFGLAPPGTSSLLGAERPDTVPTLAGTNAAIDDLAAYADVDLSGQSVPALLSGSLSGGGYGQPPTVAVAVNGTIAAVSETDPPAAGDSYAFRALLPPYALRDGRNDIEVFVLDNDGQVVSRVPVSEA